MILSKSKWRHGLGSCALLLVGGLSQAQDEAVLLKRPAELRESPGETARSLAALAARTPVTRSGSRQGAWIQVRTAEGTTGWLHLFDVGSPASVASSNAGGNVGTNALRSLTSFFNKGSAQGAATTATSTVGIRGLGAEDLARSQPNPAAVAQADALRLDAEQARRFASAAALSSRQVEALPEPAPVQTGYPTINTNNQ